MTTTDPVARAAILVACFNDGDTLPETIASLRGEPDGEIILTDDGSTDPATLAVLSRLEADGLRVLRQQNGGPSAAWMNALSATATPYVMPFSSDDLLVPGAIAALADSLDEHPEAAVAYGDMHTFGAAAAYIPSAPNLCPWHVTYVNSIAPIALFRRSLLLAAGGWQRHGMEDWDLWMRLAARCYPSVHVPRLVYGYRRDAGGRFRGQLQTFDSAYEQLRERNVGLFVRRRENKRRSPAPFVLKVLFPVIDRMPFASRLLKVQLCDLVTLLFWSAGPRRTLRIVLQGIAFRRRLRSAD